MRHLLAATAILAMLSTSALAWDDPSFYEEPAGFGFNAVAGPDVYGVSFEHGTYLIDTPLCGIFFLSPYDIGNETVDTWYTAFGLTFRLMPHTDIAPFIGGGASYHFVMSNSDDDTVTYNNQLEPQSFWAAQVEAGLRWWVMDRDRYIEALGRAFSADSELDNSYWVVGIGYGVMYGN